MEYHQLLEDYLNRDYVNTVYRVLSFEDRGTFIEVNCNYDDDYNKVINIDLFELIVFVYSDMI